MINALQRSKWCTWDDFNQIIFHEAVSGCMWHEAGLLTGSHPQADFAPNSMDEDQDSFQVSLFPYFGTVNPQKIEAGPNLYHSICTHAIEVLWER